MKKVLLVLLCGAVGLGTLALMAEPAQAIPPFKKEFDLKYLHKDSQAPNEVALVEVVEKVKCNVCHVGKDKKMRNAYGDSLAELLDKKEDAKNPEKIQDALIKVEALNSVPGDANSPTFGDLIRQGKLPGGNAEEE